MKQTSFEKTNWQHRFSHGGSLRNQRAGRTARPLSTKEPIHLVMKANKEAMRGGLRSSRRFALIHAIVKTYSKRFFIKIEQVSIQNDHIHFVVRISRRSLFQNFLRVLGGQIAQRFDHEGLLQNKPVTDTPNGASIRAQVHKISTDFLGRPAADVKPSRRCSTDVGTEGVAVTTTQKRLRVKLWKHRPFTRVVRGRRAYKIVRDYVQLNEMEARGEIPYSKQRLKGLRSSEIEELWC